MIASESMTKEPNPELVMLLIFPLFNKLPNRCHLPRIDFFDFFIFFIYTYTIFITQL